MVRVWKVLYILPKHQTMHVYNVPLTGMTVVTGIAGVMGVTGMTRMERQADGVHKR